MYFAEWNTGLGKKQTDKQTTKIDSIDKNKNKLYYRELGLEASSISK